MKAVKIGISALIFSGFLTATSQAFPILGSQDNFIFEKCPTEIEQKLKLDGKCYLAWVGHREKAGKMEYDEEGAHLYCTQETDMTLNCKAK